MENVVPGLPVSASSKRHIRTSIRRFNDYLSDNPYVFRKNKGAQLPPLIFQDIVNGYITDMSEQKCRPATIEVRKIFATQFLVSVYKQRIRSISEISGSHVGYAVLSATSVEGMCQKLPCFLKYLYKKGLTDLELQKAIPSIIPKKNLVFTCPTELNPLLYANQRELYSLFFHAAAGTVMELSRNPAHLEGTPGFISIMHTWGSNLLTIPISIMTSK